MNMVEIIEKKKFGQALSAEEIDYFVKGAADGSIPDYQLSALLMAIRLNGMNREETVRLTLSMAHSGDMMDLSMLKGVPTDKHSTGGVGDTTSLVLAPLVAACGVPVAKMSGRGLGHTGGTLDKFDSIPGYQTVPSNELFKKVVKEVGCAIIGQTGSLAPADKKIYALRDVCATVESVELITASILSKKLAAGLDCLVMDLKCGNGAFMENLERGQQLARSIVNVANQAGCKTKAVLTDMNQVLGWAAGNAVEVKEAVEYLKGESVNPRLHKITLELCAELLVLSKTATTIDEAKVKLQKVLDNGKALEKFAQMVSALGGPNDFCENPDKYLPKAAIVRPVFAEREGYVIGQDTRGIGLSIIELKGGRITPEQKLDYATGYSNFCQLGDKVDTQKPLAVVHAQTEEQFVAAQDNLRKLVTIGDVPIAQQPEIIEKIG